GGGDEDEERLVIIERGKQSNQFIQLATTEKNKWSIPHPIAGSYCSMRS
ncbi:8507_t:CDS:1, partial [Acaulospora morrowiae]